MWYMNEEREALRNMAREFTETEVKPIIAEMEEKDLFPLDVLRKAAEIGILSLILPPNAGGIGPRWVDMGICLEEIARESPVVSSGLCSQYAGTSLLTMLGREDIDEKILQPIARGEFIMATAQCEPTGQTRLEDHKTRLTQDENGEWILNGSKIFCTNAGQAEYYVICAKMPEDLADDMGQFGYVLVHKDTPGFKVGHIENKLGWHGSSTGQLYFNDCRLPEDALLLAMDMNAETTYYGGGPIGLLLSAAALGGAEGVFEKTLANARERMHGDECIFDKYQAMRHTFAELKMEIETLRGMVYSTLTAQDAGDVDAMQASWICKKKAAEVFEHVASQCIVLNGGNGLIRENGIERYLRDAKVFSIGCFALPHITEMIANHLE